MTLLIFTPTYGDGPRPETMRSVSQQRCTVATVHEVSWQTPIPGQKFKNVVAQYQRAWQMAKAGGYEALLTVEHDMVLPPDAIEKLWNTDAPVVYGVYMLRHGTPTLSAWRYENSNCLGMSLSLYPKELRQARERGWVEVCGVGWGCTLIRREVFERLTVRGNDEHDAGDLAFGGDCIRAGIKQIARFDVPCGHFDHNGKLLTIDRNGGIVSRVYALQNVTANIDGQSKPLIKDKYYSIPVDVALELQRAGYVRITNDDDDSQSQEAVSQIEQRETAVDPKAKTKKTRVQKSTPRVNWNS
jgi:hypothetical protein